MQVVDVKLGAEGDCVVTLSGGVLSLMLSEKTAGLQGGINVNIPLAYFLDALKVKANNPIVTSIVSIVEGVLAGMA